MKLASWVKLKVTEWKKIICNFLNHQEINNNQNIKGMVQICKTTGKKQAKNKRQRTGQQNGHPKLRILSHI